MKAILSAMIVAIYNFLYQPGSIVDIFTEFNGYVLTVYSDGWFANTYNVLKVIGVGMLVVGCLVSLADKVSEGDFTIHVLFRHLLKYVIWYMVLLNSMRIFMFLMSIATKTFDEMKLALEDAAISDVNFHQGMLTNGIAEMTPTSRYGMFMMLIIPYLISLAFSVVLCFFATSRLIESVLRIAMAPVVAGLSYFGTGDSSDFVRFAKRTMGVFFQIVVVLAVAATLMFVQKSFALSGGAEQKAVADPLTVLVEDFSTEEVLVDYDNWSEVPEEDKDTVGAYTPDSISSFVDEMLNIHYFPITCGLMIAAILLVFKSREISTRMF